MIWAACFGAISDKHKSVLALRYKENQSRAKMAEILQLTEDGVKAMLRRIREALGSCIRKRLSLGES